MLNPKTIEEQLETSGEVMVCSAGTSMAPMLRDRRDMVVIEKVQRALKKHDVPLYRLTGGKLVLHRILAIKNGIYVIRGDNLFQKEHVKPEQIIGVLKGFYREGKYYDCATNRPYKLYVAYVRVSYPIRHMWRVWIRPALSKIKHTIIRG